MVQGINLVFTLLLLLTRITSLIPVEYAVVCSVALLTVSLGYELFSVRKNIFSPYALFLISILIFLASRPISALFLSEKYIVAGFEQNLSYVFYSNIFLIVVIFVASLFRKLLYIRVYNLVLKVSLIPTRTLRSNILMNLSFVLAIIFGVYFLIMSFAEMNNMLNAGSYFEFASNNHSYFKYFFLSKYFLILAILLRGNKQDAIFSSVLVFIFSIGFILIGLRGYTIAYLFVFLVTYSIYFNIKLRFLVSLLFLIPIIGGYILEVRLGYKIYESVSDMFLMFFYQQGATFEVLYGSIAYNNEITSCFSPINHFFNKNIGLSFASCVDLSRGVYFESGGFGTSFFAEVYHILPLGIIFIAFFLLILVIVDAIYFVYKEKRNERSSRYLFIVLFLLIPNLVYFARSNMFDFLLKVSEVVFFFFIIVCLVCLVPTKKFKGRDKRCL